MKPYVRIDVVSLLWTIEPTPMSQPALNDIEKLENSDWLVADGREGFFK